MPRGHSKRRTNMMGSSDDSLANIADVLCNQELYDYAEQLKKQGDREHLLDLAEHVYNAATTRGKVKCSELKKPNSSMNLDQLYGSIMACCTCGIQKLAGAGKATQYDSALQRVAKHGASAYMTKHIAVTDAPYMAKQLIKAQCFEGEPNCPESYRCKQKGICWKMDVEDDKVSVTRSRAGGETHCYTYACKSEKEYNKLLKETAKTRDHVLRQGHF